MMRPVGRLCWLCLMALDAARNGCVCAVLTGQNMRWFALLALENHGLKRLIQPRFHQDVIDRLCQRFDRRRIRLTIP